MIWRHLLRIFLLAVGQAVGSFFALVVGLAALMTPDAWSVLTIPLFVFFFPLLVLDWVGIELFEDLNLTWFALNNLLWVLTVYTGWLLYVRLRRS